METNVVSNSEVTKKPSLFGVITSPTIQFKRMKEKAPVALPLIYMIVLFALTGATAAYIAFHSSLLKDTGVEIPKSLTLIGGVVGTIVTGIIGFLLAALFYKICTMVMGKDTPYKTLLSVVIHASIISVLGGLINAIINLAIGADKVMSYTSLAPLINDKNFLGVAQSIDVFHIWYYVVLGIGLHVVAELNKNKAITLIVIMFIIMLGINSLGGLIPTPK
ncbi:Yip1 family protein [Bacillus sp. MUM 13]|uniref:Yip1 family protein n=1 Tax=Bacillus sp. MUM 13 TaxID=1678001 RepID=UPI0008F5C385|nr:Yip1 family protein [Bacillus sp. MUM 13]OIK09967.1 YIP1 family protein [Bacillus sp. MUM 13]